MKQVRASSTKSSAPIAFGIVVPGDNPGDPEVVHEFRVPRKQRTDIAAYSTTAVRLGPDGRRIIDHVAVRNALITFCAREVWVVSDEPVAEDALPAGRWEPCDDAERLVALLNSPRVNVDGEDLADILVWVMEETASHPSGAARP